MNRWAIAMVFCLLPFAGANAQDSAKEKLEEILRKIERAGGKNKEKEKAAEAAAAKIKESDFVPNVPGPKEVKNNALARVKFKGTGKAQNIGGQVIFKQKGDEVLVAPVVQGLPDGEYGFHIHALGECKPDDFSAAGGHFNPQGKNHGGRSGEERHAGDLGNLKIAGGQAAAIEALHGVSVTVGKTGIIGRTLIIHANPDDGTSQPAGNAGPRIACGVITYD